MLWYWLDEIQICFVVYALAKIMWYTIQMSDIHCEMWF